MSRRVLLIIDLFNPENFSQSPGLASAALAAARRTAALKLRLRRARVPVIYANDNFGQWQSNFSTLVSICKGLSGESGQIAKLLAPGPDDWALLKPRHSAFYGTPLDFMLDELGARSLVLTGVMTDSCIAMTANDAHMRKYDIWVPGDCVASASHARSRAALRQLERVAGATTGSSSGGIPRHAAL
jgi:nicotinamidase-related amidase